MSTQPPSVLEKEIRLSAKPIELARSLRNGRPSAVLLDGTGGFHEDWLTGPLVAVDPRVCLQAEVDAGSSVAERLARLQRRVATRRAAGGSSGTGTVALLAYDLFEPDPSEGGSQRRLPRLSVLSIDRSVHFGSGERALLTVRSAPGSGPDEAVAEMDRLERLVLRGAGERTGLPAPARGVGPPRTSLPRADYLRALARVRYHIGRGDIYQANLCQQFRTKYEGDVFELYARLAEVTPAPHSAFVQTPELALASVSPETFLRMRSPDALETWPIKGTRARGATPEADRAAAEALRRSEKDRAELLMIVDLERNDLSRVCRAGTVKTSHLAALRTYPAVHHLVARVEGRLRAELDVVALLGATFPGGSITGAPKLRAMEILRDLEPVSRNLFTGALLWLGDDGRLDSSILIRSLVFDRDQVFLGAGGGVVADSDPEDEWRESNHKARPLAKVLGFDPEEAV